MHEGAGPARSLISTLKRMMKMNEGQITTSRNVPASTCVNVPIVPTILICASRLYIIDITRTYKGDALVARRGPGREGPWSHPATGTGKPGSTAPSLRSVAHFFAVGVFLAVFFAFMALCAPLDYLFAASFGLMGVSFSYVFFTTLRLPGKDRIKAYLTGVIPYFMAIVLVFTASCMVPYIVLLFGLGPFIEEVCKSSMAPVPSRYTNLPGGICIPCRDPDGAPLIGPSSDFLYFMPSFPFSNFVL